MECSICKKEATENTIHIDALGYEIVLCEDCESLLDGYFVDKILANKKWVKNCLYDLE